MCKSKKGFTLIEIMVVCLILGILSSIALPKYRVATRKSQLAGNLPLMKALQEGMVNFYNLNGTLPTELFQLPLDRSEFDIIDKVSAKHKRSRCVFSLETAKNAVTMNCNQGWDITYSVEKTPLGYALGTRTYHILDEDSDLPRHLARSFSSWEEIEGEENSYKMP